MCIDNMVYLTFTIEKNGKSEVIVLSVFLKYYASSQIILDKCKSKKNLPRILRPTNNTANHGYRLIVLLSQNVPQPIPQKSNNMCFISYFNFESMAAKSNLTNVVDVTFVFVFLPRGLREKEFDRKIGVPTYTQMVRMYFKNIDFFCSIFTTSHVSMLSFLLNSGIFFFF